MSDDNATIIIITRKKLPGNGSDVDSSDDIFRPTKKKAQTPSIVEPIDGKTSKKRPPSLFSCNSCEAHFKDKRSCTRHERNFHNENSKFLCAYCATSCSSKQGLDRHEYKCQVSAGVRTQFLCVYCAATFSNKWSCDRHENSCIANPGKNLNKFMCVHCNASFIRKESVAKHLQICTSITSKPQERGNKVPCLIKECGEKFQHKTKLIEHMRLAHHDVITIQPKISKTFPSIKEFRAWKEEEEENTFSYFTARQGQKPKSAVKYYYCQHDGSEKNHAERLSSRRRKIGRVRVGNHCIAFMRVKELENKSVHVDYHPTHSHVCKQEDVLRHPIPAVMSKFIDDKLAENIPPDIVYELTKERFLSNHNPALPTRAGNLNRKLIKERARKMLKKRQPLEIKAEDFPPSNENFYNFERDMIREKSEEQRIFLHEPNSVPGNLKKKAVSDQGQRKRMKRQQDMNDVKALVPVNENFYNFQTDDFIDNVAGEILVSHTSSREGTFEVIKSKLSCLQELLGTVDISRIPEHTLTNMDAVLSDFINHLSENQQEKFEKVKVEDHLYCSSKI
nr:PREDICTED: uncharacterized protein LOC109034715 isoform X2 [Bemisia tabaci]